MKGTHNPVEARGMMFQSLKHTASSEEARVSLLQYGLCIVGAYRGEDRWPSLGRSAASASRAAAAYQYDRIRSRPEPQAKSPDDNAKTNALHVDVPYGHTWSPSLSNLIAGALGGKPKTNWQPQQIDNPASMGPAGSVHTTLSGLGKNYARVR